MHLKSEENSSKPLPKLRCLKEAKQTHLNTLKRSLNTSIK